MFGKNPRRSRASSGDTLWVQEVFPTIQGEGPDTGTAAIFVRLAGCNLACWFCDTEFESSEWEPTYGELLDKIDEVRTKEHLVVITGGEPFRQDIGPLIEACNAYGLSVQVETAGTLWWDWIPELFKSRGADRYPLPDALSLVTTYTRDAARPPTNTIICSPKTPRVHPKIGPYLLALKYVVSAGLIDERDGLPTSGMSKKGPAPVRPGDVEGAPFHPSNVLVQPCDEQSPVLNALNIGVVVRSAQRFGYRVSVQTHKVLGVE